MKSLRPTPETCPCGNDLTEDDRDGLCPPCFDEALREDAADQAREIAYWEGR